MYNYSVCCGVTSVGAIDMKLVQNGEKVGNCARYFAIKRVTKSDKSATKSIQKNVAKNLLPGVNGHLLPGVNRRSQGSKFYSGHCWGVNYSRE